MSQKEKTKLEDLRKINNLEVLLQKALGRFFKRDKGLIENKVIELSVSGKLAMILYDILNSEFEITDNISLDVEYNKKSNIGKDIEVVARYMANNSHLTDEDLSDLKILFQDHNINEEEKITKIRPDIVLHRRKFDDSNIFVIEVKHLPTDELLVCNKKTFRYDYTKLKILTFPPPASIRNKEKVKPFFNYTFGVHIGINTFGAIILFFEKGKLIKKSIVIPQKS